jgi:hypothetical protein
MKLSRPCNVRVSCWRLQRTHREPPGLDYLKALESIFRESTLISSLRLLDYPMQHTDKAYYEHTILPVIVRLDAKFPNLTTLCGNVTENGRLPSRLVLKINIDALMKGASGSLQSLNISSFCNVVLMEVLRTLQLVEVKMRQTSNFASADSWQRCLDHLVPTLRHLELSGDCIPYLDPPVVLPSLQTLSIMALGHKACCSLHTHQSSRIDIQEEDVTEEEEQDSMGTQYAMAINQRFQESTTTMPQTTLCLQYLHDYSISCSSGRSIYHINVSSTVSMLASMCSGLNSYLHSAITRLEPLCVPTDDPFTGEDEVMDLTTLYGRISEPLSSLQEIIIDAQSATDLFPWLACPENQAFSTVKVIRLSHFQELLGHDHMIHSIGAVLSSRVDAGHPIHLVMTKLSGITPGTLRMLRQEHEDALIEDDGVALRV